MTSRIFAIQFYNTCIESLRCNLGSSLRLRLQGPRLGLTGLWGTLTSLSTNWKEQMLQILLVAGTELRDTVSTNTAYVTVRSIETSLDGLKIVNIITMSYRIKTLQENKAPIQQHYIDIMWCVILVIVSLIKIWEIGEQNPTPATTKKTLQLKSSGERNGYACLQDC